VKLVAPTTPEIFAEFWEHLSITIFSFFAGHIFVFVLLTPFI